MTVEVLFYFVKSLETIALIGCSRGNVFAIRFCVALKRLQEQIIYVIRYFRHISILILGQ